MIRVFAFLLGCACASVCLAHGGLEARVADLTARLAATPGDAGLYVARGDVYRQHQDYAAALADYAAARRLDPSAHELDLREGRAWLESGSPRRAASLLDRFLTDHPDDARALVVRARAHGAMKHWLDAAEDLALVQKLLDKPAPDIFIDRAMALLNAGPTYQEAAFANLAAGVERLGPIVTLIRFAVSNARERALNAEALHWLDRLPPSLSAQPVWLVERGEVLAALDRHDDAALAYKAALTRIQDLPVTRRLQPATRALEVEVRGLLQRED